MNREILRLAVPNIISNITVPLLGMIDIAIAGRMGGNDSTIGALAVGTAIFNFIYWNFAFLRMGTSGLTAQAYGAGNKREVANILGRSMVAALAVALLLLVFNRPVGRFALTLMQGSPEVMALAGEYFFARIWAAPAAIGIFALHGWFIGMQDSTTPMVVTIINNLINIACSLWFVFGLDMGVAGIAWGTVVAQYAALVISLAIMWAKYKAYLQEIDLRECLRMEPLVRFLRINSDAFLRTLCVCTVYTCFTAFSARFGDTILATNELLMQLFMLFSYMLDGFCYAAESLTGRFIGEGNKPRLQESVRRLLGWSAAVAGLYIVVYLLWWRPLLGIFSDSPTILACAEEYVVWIVMVPLLSFVPFLIDGILIGATKTRIMRNTTFGSLVAFFVLFYGLEGLLGNRALWLAYVGFIVVRCVLMLIATKGVNADLLMQQDRGNSKE
ncbi:MAG: MATE family efflux transporter [Tidjanibacter sp.]|nr:MATE family efflux transporter [Tidjanibacter sp.]